MNYNKFLFALILVLSFLEEGQGQKIKVFRTEGAGLQPPSIIVLTKLDNGYKTFVSDMYTGMWKQISDTLFLNYENLITKNELSHKKPVFLPRKWEYERYY